jgi:hypothetical protein
MPNPAEHTGAAAGSIAVKLVSSRYRTADDEPGLPGEPGDLLLSFYLQPEPDTALLRFNEMRLSAQLRVLVGDEAGAEVDG